MLHTASSQPNSAARNPQSVLCMEQSHLIKPFLFQVHWSLPLIKVLFSLINHSLSSSFKCKQKRVPNKHTSCFSPLPLNYRKAWSWNAHPPASCFATPSQEIPSADYSGKKNTLSLPLQLAIFQGSTSMLCGRKGKERQGHHCWLQDSGQPL